MVKTFIRTALREIRQSMGRFLAILAIVALGVGLFSGLRASQPAMMRTGIEYIREQRLYDFRVLSTLGFTREDVEALGAMEGIGSARGAVYTDFLMEGDEGEEVVLRAHSLTEGIDVPKLTAGRMPEAGSECLADARRFTEEDIGTEVNVSAGNDKDTLELLRYGSYTIAGLCYSPYYLNYERGSSSIGNGSITAFLYIPEDGFDFEVYHEAYLTVPEAEEAYSDAYKEQIEGLKPAVEALTEERAGLRYDALYNDALEEIADAEEELADGWDEYRSERADVEKELADAKGELEDGERKYADGLAEYERGLREYNDGQREYEDGLAALNDAKARLDETKPALESGWTELEENRVKLEEAKAGLDAGQAQLAGTKAALDSAKAELDAGEGSFAQLETMYRSGAQLAQAAGVDTPAQLVAALESGASPELNAAVSQALEAQGSSLEEFLGGWNAAELAAGQPLTEEYLTGLRATLDEGKAEYDGGMEQYQTAMEEYEEGRKSYDEGYRQYSEALARYEEGKAAYDQGTAEYEQGLLDIADAKTELEDARAEMQDAKAELDDARQELDDGWAEYNDGLAEAEEKFADAEDELAEGQEKIDDAYGELGKLKAASTYVLTREENTGYVCFDNDTSIIKAISVVFPVFFFLVAALVCMTTMTRMVDEQRTQIGVLKALGYSNGQVMGKYLFYAGSAALIGSVVGYAAGVHGLPWILWEIYDLIYGFAPLIYEPLPVLAAVSFAAALLCSMGATYLSCRMELSRQAAELIRPKAPRPGKRVVLEYITPLWRRLSFLRKVSLRNVLRYHSRLIMMVLGIGGCTALLVTGFGIQDSIATVADNQFDEISLYDYAVTFQENQDQAFADVFLERHGFDASDGLLVRTGSVDVIAGGGSKSVYSVVSSTGSVDGFISLHSGKEAIAYPSAGEVVVNNGLAEKLGIEVGGTIRLRDENLGDLTVTVSGIADNYVYNYVYIAPETYREQLNRTPKYNALYVHGNEGADPYREGAGLLDDEDVGNVAINASTRDWVNTMLARLDYIVVVIVICAAALAFIVLFNLTNINITERVREIATIKVLGFYQGEVAAYVFREINILSVLGGLAGLLMGKALHGFVMAQIQIDAMFFATRVTASSYLISFVVTMAFTLLISFSMRPRIKRIDMAESLKSIE